MWNVLELVHAVRGVMRATVSFLIRGNIIACNLIWQADIRPVASYMWHYQQRRELT